MPYLRLVRAGTLFSPAADVVAGACLVGASMRETSGGSSAAIATGAAASVSIYAAGMVLNDHADRREDAVHRPERPIPSGAIGKNFAFVLGLVLLAVGVAVAPHRPYWLAIATLVLAYDYVLKRAPVTAAVTMGTLRGMNLLAGSIAVLGTWPDARGVWIAAGVYAIYIVAVTILGIFEDETSVSPRAVLGVQTIPPVFAPLALLAQPQPWPAAGIGLALAAAFGMRAKRIGDAWDQGKIRRSMMWLLLGTMAYTSLLCLANGFVVECLAIAAAILAARWIARSISLT